MYDSWRPPDWHGRRRIEHPVNWGRLPEGDVGIAFVQEKRDCGHQNWWYLYFRKWNETDVQAIPVMGQTIVTATPGTTQTLTSDATWDNNANSVEAIGAGSVAAIGASTSTSGGGGGGGAYTRILNMTFATPGTTQYFARVGAVPAAAGTAGDSWLTQTSPGTTFPAAAQVGLGARGATPIASTTTTTGSAGGAAGSSYVNPATSSKSTSGGKGGNAGAANSRGGAGGGAGGFNADGDSPPNSTSAAQAGGDGNDRIGGGGAGGPAGNGAGANGNRGSNISVTGPTGSGGGGGGANAGPGTGGAGGLYGAGGGGGGRSNGVAGAGAQGVVVLSWQIPVGAQRNYRHTEISPRQVRPRLDATWINPANTFLIPPPPPAEALPNYDWQVPPSMVGRSVDLGTWTEGPQLVPPPQQFGGVPTYDWQVPPSMVGRSADLGTWQTERAIYLPVPVAPAGEQFFEPAPRPSPRQQTWTQGPRPESAVQAPVGESILERTPQAKLGNWAFVTVSAGLKSAAVQAPVGESIFDRPSPISWYRDWNINLQGTTLFPTVAAPFSQDDWPLPSAPRRIDETWFQGPLVESQPPPVGDEIFRKPPAWFFPARETKTWIQGPLPEAQPPPVGDEIFRKPPSWYFPYREVRSWTQGPLPEGAAVQAPFSQDDWPNPLAPRRIDETWFQGPLVESQPQPVGDEIIRKPPAWYFPPREVRTWIQGPLPETQVVAPVGESILDRPLPVSWYRDWVVNLQETTLFPTAAPFSQDDWPLPSAPRRIDETWATSYTLSLIGQDAMLVGEQRYDRPAPVVWYRDWSVNLQENTLTPSVAPVGEQTYELPRTYPRKDQTWTFSFNLELEPLPIGESAFELPQRSYPRLDESWYWSYNLNLIGKDRMAVGKQHFDRPAPVSWLRDWSINLQETTLTRVTSPVGEAVYDRTPRGYAPQVPSWYWSYNLNLIGRDVLPTGEQVSDRPRPVNWYQDWATNLQETTLATAAAQVPPGENIFDRPPPVSWLRDWSQNLLENTLSVLYMPSRIVELPLPVAVIWYQDWSINLQDILTPTVTVPPGENVFDRPAPVSWYRDWSQNLQENTLSVLYMPSRIVELPLPTVYPRLDQTWVASFTRTTVTSPAGEQIFESPRAPVPQVPNWYWSYNLNLIGKDRLPTGEILTERPPPVQWYRDWALNLADSTLAVVFYPENQFDWPLPKARPRLDQTWAGKYNQNLIGKDRLPTGEQSFERTPRGPQPLLQTFAFSEIPARIPAQKKPQGAIVYDLVPRGPQPSVQIFTGSVFVGSFPAPTQVTFEWIIRYRRRRRTGHEK